MSDQCITDKRKIAASTAHESATVNIDRYRQLFTAVLRHPDIQIEAVLTDRDIKIRIAVKFFVIKCIAGIAELNALAAITAGMQHPLPWKAWLRLAPAQPAYRRPGIRDSLIYNAAALPDAFDFSIFSCYDHK